MTYIFIQNSVQIVGWDKLIAKSKREWINEAIDPSFMFKWFVKEFHGRETGSSTSTVFKLRSLFEKHFNQHFSKIVESEIRFGQKIHQYEIE